MKTFCGGFFIPATTFNKLNSKKSIKNKQHNLMQLIWGKILKKLKMLIIKIFQRNNNSYTSEKNANTS